MTGPGLPEHARVLFYFIFTCKTDMFSPTGTLLVFWGLSREMSAVVKKRALHACRLVGECGRGRVRSGIRHGLEFNP